MPPSTGVQLTGGISENVGGSTGSPGWLSGILQGIGSGLGGLLSSGGSEGGGTQLPGGLTIPGMPSTTVDVPGGTGGGSTGQPGQTMALSYHEDPVAPPQGPRIQVPPYQPQDIIKPAPVPYLAQDATNITSDAAPTPYQLWRDAQPPAHQDQFVPAQPIGQMGTAQGYPGIPGQGMPVGYQHPGPYGQAQPIPGGPGILPPGPGGWSNARQPYFDAMQDLSSGSMMAGPRLLNEVNYNTGQNKAYHQKPVAPVYRQGYDPNVSRWQNAWSRGREVLNSRYSHGVSEQNKAELAARDKALERQWQERKEGLEMMRAAAAQEVEMAKAEQRAQLDALQEILKDGASERYEKALEFMARQWPTPSPERTRYILDEFNRTRGMIDLRPYFDRMFTNNQTLIDNRLAGMHAKEQLIDQRGQLFPNMLAKAKANAMTAQDRAEIVHATKSVAVALANTRAEKAQLDLALQQGYGDETRRTALAVMKSSIENMERKEKEQVTKGAHSMITDFLRLENLKNNSVMGDEKRYEQMIVQAYGPRLTITADDATRRALEEMHIDPQRLGSLNKYTMDRLKEKSEKIRKRFDGLPENVAKSFHFLQKESPEDELKEVEAKIELRHAYGAKEEPSGTTLQGGLHHDYQRSYTVPAWQSEDGIHSNGVPTSYWHPQADYGTHENKIPPKLKGLAAPPAQKMKAPNTKLKAAVDPNDIAGAFVGALQERGGKPLDKPTPEQQKLIRDMAKSLGMEA